MCHGGRCFGIWGEAFLSAVGTGRSHDPGVSADVDPGRPGIHRLKFVDTIRLDVQMEIGINTEMAVSTNATTK